MGEDGKGLELDFEEIGKLGRSFCTYSHEVTAFYTTFSEINLC